MASRTGIVGSKAPLQLLHKNFNDDCEDIVSALWAYVRQNPLTRDYIWIGRGWDFPSRSIEHGTGRAVDIMITERTGLMRTAKEFAAGKHLVDLLIRHGKTLKIQWVLFSLDGRTTWSYNMDRGTWKKLAYRGNNLSANHVDHIHLYFKSGAKLPVGFDFDVKKIPVVYASHLRSAAIYDPPKNNQNPGKYGAEVRIVEAALRAEGFRKHLIDGHFGKGDVASYSQWQQHLGYEGTEKGGDADGIPGFESLSALGKRHGFTVVDR